MPINNSQAFGSRTALRLLLRFFLLGFWLQSNTALASAAGPSPAFAANDRWAVLGDSITHSGTYHREVELFYLTRLPDLNLELVNCGISGDTAERALKRLDWDCLDTRPTLVSVLFGMNDVGRDLFDPSKTNPEIETARAARVAAYERSMRELVRRLLAAQARVILVTPTPFDDTAQLEKANLPGCGPALAALGELVRALAAEFKLPVVDFSGPMTTINLAQQARDPSYTLIGPDRVHPGKPGHLVMSHLFLAAQAAPGLVSSITIDAAGSGRAEPVENARVADLAATPYTLAFTATENALPFPVDPQSVAALDLVPFTTTFNRQLLRVTNLAPGRYRLDIDDEPIGEFSAEDLAAGINLATQTNTPQYRQASAVRAALGRKWDATAKLRTIAYSEHFAWTEAPRPFDPEVMCAKIKARLAGPAAENPFVRAQHELYFKLKPSTDDFTATAAAALAEARTLARPRPHRFTLVLAQAAAPTP